MSPPSSGPLRLGPFRTIERSRSIPTSNTSSSKPRKGKLLLAADRVAALQAECGIKEARILAKFKGHHFEYAKFQQSFLPIQVPGVLADYVTLDQGTGIVHTAPGHGVDDFNTGQKYNLETAAPMDDRGVYTEGCRIQRQRRFFTANPIVVKLTRAARRASRPSTLQTQLSPLLALPQSRHLPRHRTVVHQNGSSRKRRSEDFSRGKPSKKFTKWKWISFLGRRPHVTK